MSNDMGLRVEEEQAATEEARMARIMARQPVQRVTHVTVDNTAKQLELPFGKLIEEQDIFKAINELRKMPNYYSAKCKEEGKWKEGDSTIQLTPDGERRWHEGKVAFDEAIDFLAGAKPAPALTLSPELSHSAMDLVKHIGPNGLNTDMLPNHVDPPTRFSRYGQFQGSIIEIIVYAAHTARDCIIKCCVCDGDSSRSDRTTLLDPQYKVCGIAAGPHTKMGTVISIILAGGFVPKTSAATTVNPAAAATAPAGGDDTTDYNVNKPETKFAEVEPGVFQLTIIGAGNPPPNVSVSKKDDAIVLRRFLNGKEIATANYGLPIPFELDEASAVYSKGTIVVTIKPQSDTAVSTEEAGTVELPGTGSEERVGIGASQSPDNIAISLTPSKFPTTVTVKLEQGEAGRTTVNLVQTFETEEDGQKCKCTATSSFRMPFTTNPSGVKIDGTTVIVSPVKVEAAPKPEGEEKKKGPRDRKSVV